MIGGGVARARARVRGIANAYRSEARVREARAELLPPAPEGAPVVVVLPRLPKPGEDRLDGAGGEVAGAQFLDHLAQLLEFRGKVGDALDVRALGHPPDPSCALTVKFVPEFVAAAAPLVRHCRAENVLHVLGDELCDVPHAQDMAPRGEVGAENLDDGEVQRIVTVCDQRQRMRAKSLRVPAEHARKTRLVLEEEERDRLDANEDAELVVAAVCVEGRVVDVAGRAVHGVVLHRLREADHGAEKHGGRGVRFEEGAEPCVRG
ncbi:hypothetical protein T492DRAFT_923693 [Pavlovales sp. CCMP2436]|nr:hypothetical protein T492DRAFT_923693 [Pavlovales sp. CCMP2436]